MVALRGQGAFYVYSWRCSQGLEHNQTHSRHSVNISQVNEMSTVLLGEYLELFSFGGYLTLFLKPT